MPPTPTEGTPPEPPRRSRAPSLRLVIALVTLLPVLAAAVVLIVLSSHTSERIASELGSSMVRAAADRTAEQVRDYLGSAVRVTSLYIQRLEQRSLTSSGDFSDWLRPMHQDLGAWPEVASICIGTRDGRSTWLLRGKSGLELGVGLGPGDAQTTEHALDEATGARSQNPLRVYAYDPRKRPWYSAAINSPEGTFTPVYFWFGDQGSASVTGAGYAKPVRTTGGEHDGVVVVDVTLGALSTFLERLELARTGAVFVIDSDNLLVAASQGGVNTEKGERLRIELSESPAARAAAAFIGPPASARLDQPSTASQINALSALQSTGEPARISITAADGSKSFARLHIVRLKPFPGVDWRCLAVVPESAFLTEARSMQRRSIALALVSVVGALALAWMLSRRLSSPLLALAEHVKKIGRGDFAARLNLTHARELEDVSQELNKAAAGLQQRMEMQHALDVAMQVQQSLLPLTDPVDDRLQVVGRAVYCDATGGDYYDYLDVAHLRASRQDSAGGCMFIALGDVQGHGVGAALLMATARAALRAQALDQTSLATLMHRVNTVLATDNRHNRFMTMVLVTVHVDAQGIGGLRFASAGHDPPIVFDPRSDQFTELQGGDVPLGMFEGTDYQEYAHNALAPGSIIMIGTDGIWEMPSPSGEIFGKPRMLELIRLHAHRPAKDIADALQTALDSWRAAQAAEDDVTFVLVKVI
jgi:phosphoserine phosphatase RsbU/P